MKRFCIYLLAVFSVLFSGCVGKDAATQKYILQVCTGGWNNKNYDNSQIIDRLSKVTEMIPVEKVIIGWNLDQEQYRDVGEFLHSKGIQMLFWMPVFSEIGHLQEAEQSVDIWGQKTESFNLQEGEDFTFYCPSSKSNIQAVLTIYDRYFADCGFDGIFLDKIRTASYVAGDSGVLSCGCPECLSIYESNGLDVESLRSEWKDSVDLFHRFLSVKADIIANSVGELCDSFHRKGLIVGLDLFAPDIAECVGQDYEKITSKADFVKPMMYRKTNAPAGIGFEKRFVDPSFSDDSMDYDYLLNELVKARELSACQVYPGIEVNYREDIARTSPEYVSESFKAIRQAGLPGAVLAWDIMLAPDAHILKATF